MRTVRRHLLRLHFFGFRHLELRLLYAFHACPQPGEVVRVSAGEVERVVMFSGRTRAAAATSASSLCPSRRAR